MDKVDLLLAKIEPALREALASAPDFGTVVFSCAFQGGSLVRLDLEKKTQLKIEGGRA